MNRFLNNMLWAAYRATLMGLAILMGAVMVLGLLAMFGFIESHAARTKPACSWDKPGANPYMGSVPAAVDAYTDIPLEVRTSLKRRMERRQYDDIAVIKRDTIEGKDTSYTELRDMHFGMGGRCANVSRAKWKPTHEERGLVYCERDYCIIVPTVCRNVSRVTLVPPLVFDPPGAGPVPTVIPPGGDFAGGAPTFTSVVYTPEDPGFPFYAPPAVPRPPIYWPPTYSNPPTVSRPPVKPPVVTPPTQPPVTPPTTEPPVVVPPTQPPVTPPTTEPPVVIPPTEPPITHPPIPEPPVSPPVPEPATWALILVGLAVMSRITLKRAVQR